MNSVPSNDDSALPVVGSLVIVLGIGRWGGSLGAIRYLLDRGLDVHAFDRSSKPSKEADTATADLRNSGNLKLEWGNDSPPDSLLQQAALLVVSPAIPPSHPSLLAANRLQIRQTTEIGLLLDQIAPQSIIVSGSNGKTTTSRLIEHVLSGAEHLGTGPETRRVWYGGNDGGSLLSLLPQITADDIVVLEISSFQLTRLQQTRFRIPAAVITGYAANHLDWHPSERHYRQAKQTLLKWCGRDSVCVLPESLREEDGWRTTARVLRFGLQDYGDPGAWFDDNTLVVRLQDGCEDAVRLPLPAIFSAVHQRSNLCAAAAVCGGFGISTHNFLMAARSFRPPAFRMQAIPADSRIQFVNDSASTTPQSTLAALKSDDRPCVLILGGSDKQQDLDSLIKYCRASSRPIRLIAAMGPFGRRFCREFEAAACKPGGNARHQQAANTIPVQPAANLRQAFSAAVACAQAGDMVLFSPGAGSAPEFQGYDQRGQAFCREVEAWIASQL